MLECFQKNSYLLTSSDPHLPPRPPIAPTHPPAPPHNIIGGGSRANAARVSQQPEIPSSDEDIGENWPCSACTFSNHPWLDKCEMCEMPRMSSGDAALGVKGIHWQLSGRPMCLWAVYLSSIEFALYIYKKVLLPEEHLWVQSLDLSHKLLIIACTCIYWLLG